MRRLLPLLLTTSSGIAGCNALFGIESGSFEPTDTARDGAAPRVDAGGLADGARVEADADPCVELQTNPRHCGVCNHSCFGGPCLAGKCQPYELTREPNDSIFGLAVGAERVFYSDGKTSVIKQVSLTGGPATLFHTPTPGFASRLAVYGDGLFFIDTTGVMRCPVAGCAEGPSLFVGAGGAPLTAFAIDADGLLAIAQAGDPASIGRCVRGPCADQVDVIASNEKRPAGIAVSKGNVAWTLFGPAGGSQSLRIATVGKRPSTLVSGDGILTVAMSSDRVVYTTSNGIFAISFDSSARTLIGSTVRAIDVFAIDGESVLYADQQAHAVMRAPLDGSKPAEAIATDQDDPRAVAVDATSFYWVNVNSHGIMRLAR